MPGIIHFPTSSRRSRAVTRRSLVLGAAGYAAATALGPFVSAQDLATPEGTPGEISAPMMGLFKGEARERLTKLLALVPAVDLGGPDPNSWLFTWLDLQTHLTALGNPDLLSGTTNVGAVTSPLVTDDPLFRYATIPEAREIFGFSALDVHHTLVTGAPPDQAVYYAGGVPVDDLPAIWEAAGYQRKESDTGDYWTAGENGELNLDTPVGQFGTGLLNNVAILNETVLVFTRTADKLQRIQTLVADGGSSAADDVDLAALIGTMPMDAVNLIALSGAALEAGSITPENPGAQLNQTTQDLLAESDDAAGPMPAIEMALFGITAGAIAIGAGATPVPQGNLDAVFFVDLLTGSATDATAAAGVAGWRIEHMTSPVTGSVYSEFFTPEFSGEDAAQGDVAALTFSSSGTIAAWGQMVMVQDLWPFAWLDEP